MKRRITTLFAGGLLALALFSVAAAGPLEDGYAAYKLGDYAAAMSYWRPLADQGDAKAQYNLGAMYLDGQGVAQDDAQALIWYRKAAVQGNAWAQYNLGVMYDTGKGVPQDDAEALIWYRKAAVRGNAPAQNNLGKKYRRWQGCAAGLRAGSHLVPQGRRPGECLGPVQPRRDVSGWRGRGAGRRARLLSGSVTPPTRGMPTHSTTSA